MRVHTVTGKVACATMDFLRSRHDQGLQRLAMDDEATAYYGEPTGGIRWMLWRARVYLEGALRK